MIDQNYTHLQLFYFFLFLQQLSLYAVLLNTVTVGKSVLVWTGHTILLAIRPIPIHSLNGKEPLPVTPWV
jgi:hypothetical protein